MGHPAPFNLKYLGIGNEQWGKEYPERLEPFIKALRKAHPEIMIVGSSGPNSEGKEFDYLWPEMKRLKADLVDEHFYRPESWFLSQGARYDNYDRKGPKVFAGEYACHGKGKKWNHFHAALLEAAFMTGLERNADIVHMATYAPLFAHVEGWQWRPDMIWFDNLNSVRTVSYYVQQLYAQNKGTNVLPLTMNKKPVTGAEGQNGLFASAVYDKDKNELIVKVANTSDKTQPVSLTFEGLKKQDVLSEGRCITLSSLDQDKDNTLEQPFAITPQETPVTINGHALTTELGPNTFAVYKFTKNKMNSVKLVMISCALAAFSGLSAQNDTTFVANGNPIIKYKYTADPGAMVHDGKVYIYAGHDECPPPREHYQLNEWCVFSSPDMKTWTEHPVPLKAKDFSWAKGEAWASQVIERDGKFYWYVTVEHGTIHGKSIGVAVSDSPVGPFVDARGSALITNDMTTEFTKISWEDIDPTVLLTTTDRHIFIGGIPNATMSN